MLYVGDVAARYGWLYRCIKELEVEIKLVLTVEETNAVLQTLGNLPTSSGVWPLVVKIKQQAEAQVKSKDDSE